MMIHTLVAENVCTTLGQKEILQAVTVSAQTGRVTALLGRNGSGKSTMLKAIYGTGDEHDSSLTIDGQHMNRLYAVKELINYLPQHVFLPPSLKVHKAFTYYDVDIDEVITLFPEIAVEKDKRIKELSSGTQKLVETLLMIKAKTKFTLLDEPFTHIMPIYAERLSALLNNEKVNKGFIITDHMYRNVLPISDDIYLVKEGKTIHILHPDDLVLHGYLKE